MDRDQNVLEQAVDVKGIDRDKLEEEEDTFKSNVNNEPGAIISNQEPLDRVDDEILRYRIRKLIDAPAPPSILSRLTTNPLTSIILGFLLTGLVGGLLTNYYNLKQQELQNSQTQAQRESDRLREESQRELDRKQEDERRKSDRLREGQQRESDQIYQERQNKENRLQDERRKDLENQRTVQQRELERERSFIDELNKVKVQKMGEVWEKFYLFEAVLEPFYKYWEKWGEALEKGDKAEAERIWKEVEPLRDASITQRENLYMCLRKNRFWLGNEEYSLIFDYCNISELYFSAITGSTYAKAVTGMSLDQLKEKRQNLKTSLDRIRARYFGN